MSFQDDIEAYGRRPAPSPSPSSYSSSTQAVASRIFQINTAVTSFNRLVNSLGTPKDTLQLRDKLHQTRLRINQLVKDTSAKLKEASKTDHSSNVTPTKKIADAKLAKDFQSVLKEFQKAQRLAAEKEATYAPFVPRQVNPSTPSSPAQEVEISSSRMHESQSLILESKRQQVIQLDNEIAFNEAIIEEREQGIREIQEQISEVNEIFKDLAVLVHEQGVIIDDVGSNVESSHAATAEGTSQLVKASKSQKSSSSTVPLPDCNVSRSSDDNGSIGSPCACLLLIIFGIILLIVVIVVVV